MHLATFFNSWPGMYLAQSFVHSLVAALIVDTALLAWNIENPRIRQRFRLLAIVMPLLAFPVYQFLDPARGSALFRFDAFFDINRWLNLEVWGAFPLGIVFLLLLGFTGAVFLGQELLPIIRHSASTRQDQLDVMLPAPDSAVTRALAGIPGNKPEVYLIEDEEALMFSSTGKRPAVYLTEAVVQALTEEELRAAIAHEIAHITRSRRPVMIAVFLLRVIMFLNPVTLMEFRRFIQEEEKSCDEVAVELTGDRAAMAGALNKLYAAEAPEDGPGGESSLRVQERLEEYSSSLLIESRIRRLSSEPAPEANSSVVYALVLTTVAGICYYVV